jgi:hypothetical protein
LRDELVGLADGRFGRRTKKNIGWLRIGTLAIFADSKVRAGGPRSASWRARGSI